MFFRFKNKQPAPAHPDLAVALAGIHPKLTLRRSARARRMALRVHAGRGIIELVLPKRYTALEAKLFAQTHQDWIARKATELPDAQPFVDGMVLSILGAHRVLRIIASPQRRTTRIILTADTLLVETPRDDARTNIIRFLKKILSAHIQQLVDDKSDRIGKKTVAISVRETHSQWGSCAHDGRLSFSWRLVFAPLETIDYVVAHEVAHRVHFNHSTAFWALAQKLSAHFDLGKNWLAQNAHTLQRIGQG